MTAIPVQTLIDELLDRIAWPTTNNSAHRAKCLVALNNVERKIAQRGSWQYLSVKATLALLNNQQKAVLPTNPAVDPLKAASLADDAGPLRFLPVGDFDMEPLDTGYLVTRTNRPGIFTIARDGGGGVLTAFFDTLNTTGSTITYSFTYQQVAQALADNTNSFSLLPETYEKTILLDGAEIEIKRIIKAPIEQWYLQAYSQAVEQFFSANRTTKPEAKTDEDISDAKAYERAMPGA